MSLTPASLRWPAFVWIGLAAWAVALLPMGRTPAVPELAGAAFGLFCLIWSSTSLRSQGFTPAFSSVRGASGVVLTFDDGPDPETTPAVLDCLKAHSARATFFVVGHKARRFPELIRRIAAEGHQIECHGDRHTWWECATPKMGEAAIRRAQSSIEQLSGNPVRFFRPPYGMVLPAMGPVLRRVGLMAVGWSRRARDGGGVGSPEAALARLAGLKAGDIVLLHDAAEREGGRRPHGPEILPRLLDQLVHQGLTTCTIEGALADTGQGRARLAS